MSLFYPTRYRRRITAVTAADLESLGVRGILLDVDNTLTTHDNMAISPAVTAWLDAVRAAGYQPIVVSNNKAPRVAPFAAMLDLPFQAKAKKPLPAGYRAAAATLGLRPEQCVVIGDQIFTDVVGANLAGMPSILLEPIEPEVEQKFIVFKRRFERVLMRSRHERERREADYRG